MKANPPKPPMKACPKTECGAQNEDYRTSCWSCGNPFPRSA